MIRPALLTLLSFAAALPVRSAEIVTMPRCTSGLQDIAAHGRGNVMVFPDTSKPEADVQASGGDGALCQDAVWRLVDQPGARVKWGEAKTAQDQAKVLAAAAAFFDKLDADVLALEAAAGNVYDAAAAGNLIKPVSRENVTIKSATFAKVELSLVDNPTQFGGDDLDKSGELLKARAAGLGQLAIAPPPPAKDAKAGATRPKAQPGPLVVAYLKALEKVRADAMGAAALGVKLPALTPIIAPSTTRLSDNYEATVTRVAAADKWEDVAAHDSLLDALQDRALRNRVARHTFNIGQIFGKAAPIAGSASAGLGSIDARKKKELDDLNAKIREKVLGSIDYETAKRAFDGDVAHDGDYAKSVEGRNRAADLAQAKGMADSAQVVANGTGGYQLQYTGADGKTKIVDGSIADLKTAQSKLDDLTSGIAKDILANHDLMAKTHAVLEAARSGATSFGEGGLSAPNGAAKTDAGCDKTGESLAEYQKRLRDEQMESSAKNSAARQPALEKYTKKMQEIADQYKVNLENKMNPDTAKKIKDRDEKTAHDEYVASTQGSVNDDIAARTGRFAAVDGVAETAFVQRIAAATPQLAANMRPNLKKYVSGPTARMLDGDDGKGQLFDQFIADEWAEGGADTSQNVDACKSTYREGDYGSLEKCAGGTLKPWLGKNVARTSPAVAAGMRGHLKKFVSEAGAKVLLVDGGSDDGKTTMFDQFLGEEWTAGQGNQAKNAAACKSGGEFEALESCTAASLKSWLDKRKAGTAPPADVDAAVRAGDRRR